jgi:class 3 adenylate cyclase/DNA-binding response OmpR family regulator
MSGERILIVDDGKENRDFIVEYVLRPNGFEALVARDGVEGMEMARQYQPDLILLDLQMPRMNGMQVLDALNAEQLNIPVILMTFHGSEEIAVEVYRKGVRDYVKKPYTVEEMYEAIDRSLAIVRLQREKDQLTERLLNASTTMNQRVRELNVLYTIGKAVTSLTDIDAVLQKVVEAVSQLTAAEESSLYLLVGDQLYCRAIHRLADRRTFSVDEVRQDPLALQAIQAGQPVVAPVEELQQAKQFNPSAPSGAMATPLIIHQQAIGALVARNYAANARVFTKNDAALLSSVSDYAAIAYSNATHIQSNSTPIAAFIEDEKDQVLRRSVVTGILSQVDKNEEAGVRREVTLMAVRLQGHISFTQKAPPEQIVSLLNNYLGLATQSIFGQEGTVVDLSGDGLIAVFNAPANQSDHIKRIAATALALKEAVAEHNQRKGGGLTLGIGLHMGEAVLGYFGDERTARYTAVGEALNLTSFLRGAAKPAQILVSEALAEPMQSYAELHKLGKLPYRGWQDGLTVYELLAMK